jgi:hypothetical protein
MQKVLMVNREGKKKLRALSYEPQARSDKEENY